MYIWCILIMDGNKYQCESCGVKSAEPMWRDFSPLKKRVVSHCDDCCSYVVAHPKVTKSRLYDD